MNNKTLGRPVDITGININEIELWMKNNKSRNSIIICQSILALNQDATMTEVCHVMGVTRETIRIWKEKLRHGGLDQVLLEKKVGKRSKLNIQRESILREAVKKSPGNYGYSHTKWSGKLVQQFAADQWKLPIGLRTAHQWLVKVK